MNRKTIIILSIAALALIIIPYLWMFANQTFSDNVSDWANFAMYISGLLMPFLTILNLIILSNVGSSIKDISDKRDKHNKVIEAQMREGDLAEFRVDIENQEAIDKSFQAVDNRVKSVYDVLNTLAEQVGDKNFEMVCLATPNVQARLDVEIAQLKVNVYQELYSISKDSNYRYKWEKAMEEMEKLHKDTYLAD